VEFCVLLHFWAVSGTSDAGSPARGPRRDNALNRNKTDTEFPQDPLLDPPSGITKGRHS
jgi:hypothetical protein